MTLALQLVTYHGARYLPSLLQSLSAQTDQDWILHVRDHSHDPREIAETQRVVAAYAHDGKTIYSYDASNPGFAGGHQALFALHASDLIMLVNQDAVLDRQYIEHLRRVFDNETVAIASGLIIRCHFEQGRVCPTEEVDTAGLLKNRAHEVRDVINMPDSQEPFDVFGVSGCLPMIRRRAVEQTSFGAQLFDPRYWMYKEDVDLAYRFFGTKWRTLTVPRAIAYHERGVAKDNRRRMSHNARLFSYRNHVWNLITHLRGRDWLRDGLWVIPYELGKILYHTLLHPSVVWHAWCDTWRLRKHLSQKRAFYARSR
ncbi:glycosyltransferase family 2 protein [Candidatus Uhrbacteria bacterium]|nr:glycosyltransferase family 2 protein [Candidatus Uhrbacteria bacterium]